MALTPIGVGSYVRFNISGKPPPELTVAANINSAVVVTEVITGPAGGTQVRVARQGKLLLDIPISTSILVAVLAPPVPL